MDTHATLTITPTGDAAKIADCARMMAASDPWVTLGLDYLQCLAAFEGPCREIYLLESGPQIAGFVILQVCGSFKGYIQTLFVAAPFRGQGQGHQLLLFSEQRILEISPNIFICVSSFNQEAIRLYYRFGFQLVGELPDFVRKGCTELLLRKTVGPMAGYRPALPAQ